MNPRPDPLREITIVEQRDPALRRRWFENDYFDLFAWQDTSGAVTRFELYYGVDHGDSSGAYPQTPILVSGGKFDSGTVVPRFERDSAALPSPLRDLVLAK